METKNIISNDKFPMVYKTKFHKRYDNSVFKSNSYKNNPKKVKNLVRESELFFGKKSASYISYIGRPTANDRIGDTKALELRKELNRPNLSGCWDKEGTLTNDELKTYKTLLTKCDLGMSGILSFSFPFSDKHIKNVLDAKRFTDFVLKKEFEYKGLNLDNFYYIGAFHTNTPHKHIHYIIFPKEKNMKFTHFFPKDKLKEFREEILQKYPVPNTIIKPEANYWLVNSHNENAFLQPCKKLVYLFTNIYLSKRTNTYKSLNKERKDIVKSYLWKSLIANTYLSENANERLMLLHYNSDEREMIISLMYNKLVSYCYDKVYRKSIDNVKEKIVEDKAKDGEEVVMFDENYVNKKLSDIEMWKFFESDLQAQKTRFVLHKMIYDENELNKVLMAIKHSLYEETRILDNYNNKLAELKEFKKQVSLSKVKNLPRQPFEKAKGR